MILKEQYITVESIPGLDMARNTAPVPMDWVDRHELWKGMVFDFKERYDLASLRVPNLWSKKCINNPLLPWALWTGIKALGKEDTFLEEKGSGIIAGGVGSQGRRVFLGKIDGLPIFLGNPSEGASFGVKYGRTKKDLSKNIMDSRILVPGLTLEEKMRNHGPDLAGLIEMEAQHVSNFLEADLPLGMVSTCGPLTPWMWRSLLQYRRKAGTLTKRWRMSKAGWWKLAYLSNQGIGQVELQRANMLSRMAATQKDVPDLPKRRLRRNHLLATQKLTLKLFQEDGYIPLGIEHSATADWIRRIHRVRADALMVNPVDGRLVWVEILRRNEGRMSMDRKARYARLRHTVLPVLASSIGNVVEVFIESPLGMEHKLVMPEEGGAFGTLADNRRVLGEVIEGDDLFGDEDKDLAISLTSTLFDTDEANYSTLEMNEEDLADEKMYSDEVAEFLEEEE